MKTVSTAKRGSRPKERRTKLPKTGRGKECLPNAAEAPGERTHGDSYSDVLYGRGEGGGQEDVGTPSSHVPCLDRRQEEPSERALGAPERLEGS